MNMFADGPYTPVYYDELTGLYYTSSGKNGKPWYIVVHIDGFNAISIHSSRKAAEARARAHSKWFKEPCYVEKI